MTRILNQYSFLIFGVLILALAIYALSRRGFRRVDWLLLIALMGLVFAAWWVMHPTASQVQDVDAVRARIGAGTPVLLEFQSPY
jgi:ABC-type glycerol-3-phosphate transport system permease component